MTLRNFIYLIQLFLLLYTAAGREEWRGKGERTSDVISVKTFGGSRAGVTLHRYVDMVIDVDIDVYVDIVCEKQNEEKKCIGR